VVRLLSGCGSLCVGAIAKRLDLTQSAVSQHLRILEEAGLVVPERKGMRVHYSIARSELGVALEGLAVMLVDGATDMDSTGIEQGGEGTCARAQTAAEDPKT